MKKSTILPPGEYQNAEKKALRQLAKSVRFTESAIVAGFSPSKIARRVSWSCSCGTLTFAAIVSKGVYYVAEHNDQRGRRCEKSRTEQLTASEESAGEESAGEESAGEESAGEESAGEESAGEESAGVSEAIHTCGGTGCEICALCAQLATAERERDAAVRQLYELQHLATEEVRGELELSNKLGSAMERDLAAARARADALEGEAGALRLALALDTSGRDFREETDRRYGLIGKRAAEVLQTARALMELHDHPDEKRREMLKADRWARLRAALAALWPAGRKGIAK